MTPLHPQQTYVRLTAGGDALALTGGDAFWSLPQQELERHGRDWLVSEFAFETDWPNWEMHPNGDEFVYLLSGAADMLFEREGRIESIALRNTGAVVVPRGVWHTARALAPSRMLHITLGGGTKHRTAIA